MTLKQLLTTSTRRQLDAIQHTKGPLLILAGADTGKTTTITTKIAYMIKEQGIDPDQILALTFSMEAASHMKAKSRAAPGRPRSACQHIPLLLRRGHQGECRQMRCVP